MGTGVGADKVNAPGAQGVLCRGSRARPGRQQLWLVVDMRMMSAIGCQ